MDRQHAWLSDSNTIDEIWAPPPVTSSIEEPKVETQPFVTIDTGAEAGEGAGTQKGLSDAGPSESPSSAELLSLPKELVIAAVQQLTALHTSVGQTLAQMEHFLKQTPVQKTEVIEEISPPVQDVPREVTDGENFTEENDLEGA